MFDEPIPGHLRYGDKAPILVFAFEDDHAIAVNPDGTVESITLDSITLDWRYIEADERWADLRELEPTKEPS